MALSDNPLLNPIGTLPPTYWGQTTAAGDARVLGWAKEAVQEGERFNQQDPNYDKMDEAMNYISGEQLPLDRRQGPPYLTKITVNESKRAVRRHVSALTDLKPLYEYATSNPQYQVNAGVFNHLTLNWWINTFADMALGSGIKLSAACGSGDLLLDWDPFHSSGQGDFVLDPRDPRDTLPIRPARYGGIQAWGGAIFREAHPPATLQDYYADKRSLLQPSLESGWGSGVFTRMMRGVKKILTPMTVLQVLDRGAKTGSPRMVDEITFYRMYLNDASRNLTGEAVLMGKPGTHWSYIVQPNELLYPRKRLLLLTERAVLYDGPSPYWHGMIPAVRLQLDPWPWSWFGQSVLNDVMPLNDAINLMVNWLLDNFQQWVNRGASADRTAISPALLKRLDIRQPNWRASLAQQVGEGLKIHDGPMLPPWTMEWMQMLFSLFEKMTETANFEQLLQLRQMPSGDTIQKYSEALTPGMRLEGRAVELALRDIGQMQKVNFLQYYNARRRLQILGPQGTTMADFDYEPGQLLPAMSPGDQNYVPELDKSVDRAQRARFFEKLFAFRVQPNSLLAINAMEEEMKDMQLARMGYLDVWTLMERLNRPNMGLPPAIPLPPKPEAQQMLQQHAMQAQQAMAFGMPAPPLPPGFTLDPMTGQLAQVRIPETITERLQAQQMLGIGMTANPAGRKATGQESPSLERKTDQTGTERVTMTESKK